MSLLQVPTSLWQHAGVAGPGLASAQRPGLAPAQESGLGPELFEQEYVNVTFSLTSPPSQQNNGSYVGLSPASTTDKDKGTGVNIEEAATTIVTLSSSVKLHQWPFGAIATPSSSLPSTSQSLSSTPQRGVRNSENDRIRLLGPLLALAFEEARFTDLAGVYLTDALYVR